MNKLDSKRLMTCLKEIRELPVFPALIEKVDLGDRFVILDIVMHAARQGIGQLPDSETSMNDLRKEDAFASRLFRRSVDWDPAFRIVNHWYDRIGAATCISDRSSRLQEMDSIRRDLQLLKVQVTSFDSAVRSFMGSRQRGEVIGNVVVATLIPAIDKVSAAKDRRDQEERNLHLAFALATFDRDKSQYPAKLEESAPKYITSIPDDLFANKPLIYRLEGKGFVLYSVGPNGIDDDGRTTEDEPRGDDLAIRLPIPEPPAKK